MKLAPICISVYDRVEHFAKVLNALSSNYLAENSELYVYSDAAAQEDKQDDVHRVRSLALSYKNKFKCLTLIERESNYGGTENALQGLKEVINHYGQIIFLEDDIVTAPGFLTYMNKALRHYENYESVFSISGYSAPVKALNNYENDIYFYPRFCGWGAGLWKSSMDMAVDNLRDISPSLNLENLKKKLDQGGKDIYFMALKELYGEISAQDVRNMVLMAEKGLYTVYPRKSLVQNIGHDGSGYHCAGSTKYEHAKLSQQLSFDMLDDVNLNNELMSKIADFRQPEKINRLIYPLRVLRLHEPLRRLKGKIF